MSVTFDGKLRRDISNEVFEELLAEHWFGTHFQKTIQDVPVEVVYNHKDLHATHVPDTVDVNISGPQSKLLKIESPDDLKVVVDLSGEKLVNIMKNSKLKE